MVVAHSKVVVEELVEQVQVDVAASGVDVADKVVADRLVVVVGKVVSTDTVIVVDVVVVKRSCSKVVETFSHLCREGGSL